ncbi:MAG: ADP-ribosylglycohydrolase family protein [Ferruginibacter sp.]|nr:ADP-ribosylglycohydrolase family protein [Ferruginibacter sp.]
MNIQHLNRDYFKDVLFGLSIGDALGVPFEFKNRDYFYAQPVTDMEGYGTYNQPPGTFSDDSSMAFCLAEALTHGYDVEWIANNFISWLHNRYWTAHDEVFDVGISTSKAIRQLVLKVPPVLAGGADVSDNGNGSLMRILPLIFYLRYLPETERFKKVSEVSSITHRHPISITACYYYMEFARLIMEGENKMSVYKILQSGFKDSVNKLMSDHSHLQLFDRLLNKDIHTLQSNAIESNGFVVSTLEASIWCVLTTGSFKEATLKAVNLGGDTDTTAAVTGGLAALLYGWKAIPVRWMNMLAKREDINDLAERLKATFEHHYGV